MKPWMWIIIAAAVVAVVLFTAALCKVAGRCSREEERTEYGKHNQKR